LERTLRKFSRFAFSVNPLYSLDRLLVTSSVFSVFFFNWRFLVSPWPAGWDTLPQIHLFYKMAEFLKHGSIFGYDLDSFGGYPLFVFYGFLPYLAAALIHLASFHLIPVLLLAKLFIVGSPVALLFSLRWFVRRYFGSEYLFSSMVAFQAYLLFPFSPELGIGLSGAVYHGLFTTTLANALLLCTLAFLEKESTALPSASVLVAALLIFTHVLTAIAGAILIGFYFLSRLQGKRAVVFLLLVLGLTAFYVYPFVAYFGLTNGGKVTSAVGGNGAMVIGVDWTAVRDVLGGQFKSIVRISILHFILLVTFIYGSVLLIKERRWFLPLSMGFYFSLIITDVLYVFLAAPLHYYRFDSTFMILYLLMAAYGLGGFLKWLSSKSKPWPYVAYAGLLIVVVPLCLNFSAVGETLNWNQYKSEKGLLEGLRGKQIAGRVFVERSRREPNPHFFNVLLPAQDHLPSLGGFVMESADNSRFINPLVRTLSAGFVWGESAYPLSLDYRRVIEKLSDAGAEILCLRSIEAISWMESEKHRLQDLVRDEGTVGPYHVYRLFRYLPLMTHLSHKPVLCVIDEKWSADDIAVMLFESDLDPRIKPVLIKASELSETALVPYDGLIICTSHLTPELRNLLDSFRGRYAWVWGTDDEMRVASGLRCRLFRLGQFKEFVRDLGDTVRVEGAMSAVNPTSVSDTSMTFQATGPIVVNIGYFPYWALRSGRVYRLLPSKLLVFSQGEERLEFRLPAAQKGLIALSFILFLVMFRFTFTRKVGNK
jgi:hypothetical protein